MTVAPHRREIDRGTTRDWSMDADLSPSRPVRVHRFFKKKDETIEARSVRTTSSSRQNGNKFWNLDDKRRFRDLSTRRD